MTVYQLIMEWFTKGVDDKYCYVVYGIYSSLDAAMKAAKSVRKEFPVYEEETGIYHNIIVRPYDLDVTYEDDPKGWRA